MSSHKNRSNEYCILIYIVISNRVGSSTNLISNITASITHKNTDYFLSLVAPYLAGTQNLYILCKSSKRLGKNKSLFVYV